MPPQDRRNDSSSSSESEDEKDSDSKSKSKKMMLIGFLVFALIAGVVLYALLFKDKNAGEKKDDLLAKDLVAEEKQRAAVTAPIEDSKNQNRAIHKEEHRAANDASDDSVTHDDSHKKHKKHKKSAHRGSGEKEESPKEESPKNEKKSKDWGSAEKNKRAKEEFLGCTVENWWYGSLFAMVFFFIAASILGSMGADGAAGASSAGGCFALSCYAALCSYCYIDDGKPGMMKAGICIVCCGGDQVGDICKPCMG